jgi:hypothetical protein
MTAVNPLQLGIAAFFCGILAFWLWGIYLHSRWYHQSRKQARHVLHINLNIPVNQAADIIIKNVAGYPHFSSTVAGTIEDVISILLSPRQGFWSGKTSCSLACRFDRMETETRLSARLDFSPFIERASEFSQIWLYGIWPLWIAGVIGVNAAHLFLGESQNPIDTIHLAHTIYPFFILAFARRRFTALHKSLDETISHLLQNVKYV